MAMINVSIDSEQFNLLLAMLDKAKELADKVQSLDTQLLKEEDVAEMMLTTRQNVAIWRNIGMIHPVKTGKRYGYSVEEVIRFQNTYKGYDIGNRIDSLKAYQEVKKAVATNND